MTEQLYSETCEDCGKKMQLSFRFTDWHFEGNDQYGSFEYCKKIFDERKKEDKEGRFSIYDVSHCPNCEYNRDEGILFNEDCPEYEV